MEHYVLASSKSWNIEAFHHQRKKLPGIWSIVTDRRDLTAELFQNNPPRYIFFMHWSHIVPPEILALAECVCIHMTDVPYGRGGSPLQNLIARGHKSTKLVALRMVETIDAGPVYAKTTLQLQGSASQIFRRCADLSLSLIELIICEEPTPKEQVGEPVAFHRRTPEQSIVPAEGEIARIYDHIRMLDADTYPRAFIDYGKFRLTFSDARLDANQNYVEATARITPHSSDLKAITCE